MPNMPVLIATIKSAVAWNLTLRYHASVQISGKKVKLIFVRQRLIDSVILVKL